MVHPNLCFKLYRADHRRANNIHYWGIEYVLWALIFGLMHNRQPGVHAASKTLNKKETSSLRECGSL